jgi:hypothetical protein
MPWGCSYLLSADNTCANVQTQANSNLLYDAVGYGYFDTRAALEIYGLNNFTAIYVAGHYSSNNYNWHLPSKDELWAMWALRNEIGLTDSWYWSSTEVSYDAQNTAIALNVSNGGLWAMGKDYNFYVRPVRYFG